MITDVNTNPQNQVYYIGSLVIDVLSKAEDKEFDFMDVFESLNVIHKTSVGLYTLTLDWLYMIGCVRMNEKGGFVRCF